MYFILTGLYDFHFKLSSYSLHQGKISAFLSSEKKCFLETILLLYLIVISNVYILLFQSSHKLPVNCVFLH